LTYLETIHFDQNELKGNMSQLCDLPSNMKQISLKNNMIGGEIPSCLADKLTEVTELNLKVNNITGSIPDELCKMTNLVALNLDFNYLSGTLPECIGDLSKLIVDKIALKLATSEHQSFWGTPRSLCNLTNIETLFLHWSLDDGRGISGPIPDCLGEKQYMLKQLDLNGISLTGTIPQSVCEASQLENIALSYWHITRVLLSVVRIGNARNFLN
jgi:hypothetical protein